MRTPKNRRGKFYSPIIQRDVFFHQSLAFFPPNKTNSEKNKAESHHTQLFCLFIAEQLYFINALKCGQWETFSLRVHDIYKHQLTRSIM